MFSFFQKTPKVQVDQPERVETVQERRAEGRRNVYADVIAVSERERDTKRGIVLDMSRRGARLRLEYGDRLVEGMIVKIPRYGISVPATVRWSNRQDIGVEFKTDR